LLHLTLAMLKSSASITGSANWNGVWPSSSGNMQDLFAAALRQAAACPPPAADLAETLRQDAALIEGIAAYRRHPWRRDLPDPPALWTEGGSRLLDYAPTAPADAIPVLFVPSLINRA